MSRHASSDFFSRGHCCNNSNGQPCPTGGWVTVTDIVAQPPTTFDPYELFLVDQLATGDFSDHDDEYAYWSSATSQWEFCTPVAGQHLAVVGTCTTYCYGEDGWEISGGSSAAYSAFNLGSPDDVTIFGLFSTLTLGNQFQYRSLEAGSNMSMVVTPEGTLRLSAIVGPAGGEANVGQNIGGGVPIYKTKVGLALQLRSFVAGDNMAVTQVGDTIRLDANVPAYTGETIGDGDLDVFATLTPGNAFQFRAITVISDDPLVFSGAIGGGDAIELSFTPGNGSISLWGDMLHLYDNSPVDHNVISYDSVNGWVNEAITFNSTGSGVSVFGSSTGLSFDVRSVIGTGRIGTSLVSGAIQVATTAELNTASSVGGGISIISGKVGEDLQFKSLVQGGTITITPVGNTLVFGGGGEVATMANMGTGAGVYQTKVLSEFRLRSLRGLGVLDATENGDYIDLSIVDEDDLVTSDGSGTAQIVEAGGIPFVLKDFSGSSTIQVSQTGSIISFTGLYDVVSMGTGADGVEILNSISSNHIRPYRIKGTGGIVVSLVGNSIVVDGSGITGGGGGGGAAAAGFVSWYRSTDDSVALDRTGVPIEVPFDDTLSAATDIQVNSDTEREALTDGMRMVTYSVTMRSGSSTGPASGHSQVKLEVWIEVNGVEVPGTRSFGHSPNHFEDEQTVTKSCPVSLTTGDTIVIMARTRGGDVTCYLDERACTLTIESSAGPATSTVTGTSTTMVPNTRYVPNNAGLVTLTLPAVSVVGDRISISGKGAGGWRIAQLASQQIVSGAAVVGVSATTAGTGGQLNSSAQYDCVELVCVTANLTWVIQSTSGTLAFV